jgi:hypothetical protein
VRTILRSPPWLNEDVTGDEVMALVPRSDTRNVDICVLSIEGNDGDSSLEVDGVHSSDLSIFDRNIVLNDTRTIRPEILEANRSSKAYAVLDDSRNLSPQIISLQSSWSHERFKNCFCRLQRLHLAPHIAQRSVCPICLCFDKTHSTDIDHHGW